MADTDAAVATVAENLDEGERKKRAAVHLWPGGECVRQAVC